MKLYPSWLWIVISYHITVCPSFWLVNIFEYIYLKFEYTYVYIFGYCLRQSPLLYVLIEIFLCWSHECSSIYIVCKIATVPPFLRHPPFSPSPSLLFSFRRSPHHHIPYPNLAHQYSLHIHTGTFFFKAYVCYFLIVLQKTIENAFYFI